MKSIKKALEILEVFLNGEKEIGISELAEITGQNISTVHDILIDLTQKGYIKQKEARGKYSLGLKFLSFSNAVNKIVALVDIIKPLLAELSKTVNETSNISINCGTFCISIAAASTTYTLRVVPDENLSIPLYCTGVGKVFLAARTNEEIDNFINSQQLIAFTPNTITDPAKLKRQLRKIRREGIGSDNEEFEKGVRNIAAPIIDGNGEVIATVGVVGPAVRLTPSRMKEIAPVLKQYAEALSDVVRRHI